MAKMSYKEFVKMHMKSMNGSPKEKMQQLAMKWNKYKSSLSGGDIQLDPGQTEAKSFKQLLAIPDAAKRPELQTQGFQELSDEIQKSDAKQAKSGNIWAPYQAPIVMPVPEGYPYFLFQHPNKYSANPNQVMVANTQGQFLKSNIYNQLKSNLKYIAAKTSGYGASARDAGIQPKKDFRIVFLFSKPDKDQYVYDAKNADDYMKVLDMCKDSGFIYPTEVLSKQIMDKNAEIARKISNQDNDAAAYAWKQGAELTQQSWEQSVSEAESQEAQQDAYFKALALEKQKEADDANKKSGWDQFLDIAGDVAQVAAKVLI